MSSTTARLPYRPLNLGMIGLGKWSHQLGHAVRRSSHVKLLSCYTRTPEKRKRYAATFSCADAATLQALVETPQLEAVILATPAHAYHDLAMVCVERGLHLFVEKPMALTLQDALQLNTTCENSHVTLMVGHEMRRLGSMRAAKKLVQAGDLGQIVSANASMTLSGRFEPDNWRCHRDTNRGGALMQLGIHAIENLNYLLGQPLWVRGAFANALAPNDVHDVGVAIITYEKGVTATVSANYVSPASQKLSLYGTRANLHLTIDMSVWPDATQADEHTQLWLEDGNNRAQVPITPRDVLVEQLDDFAHSVRRKVSPETGAKEGLWAVGVVEAAIRSAGTGRPVQPATLIANYQKKGNDDAC